MNLKYQWYHKGKEVQEGSFELTLTRGDMYIMSHKATGNDWKKRNIPTLRHAAGCPSYSYTESDKIKAREAKKEIQNKSKLEKKTIPAKKEDTPTKKDSS